MRRDDVQKLTTISQHLVLLNDTMVRSHKKRAVFHGIIFRVYIILPYARKLCADVDANRRMMDKANVHLGTIVEGTNFAKP